MLGIGGVSLLAHRRGIESYKSLLELKIIWSVSAIVGLILSFISGAPKVLVIIILTFLVFSLIWIRYRILIKN